MLADERAAGCALLPASASPSGAEESPRQITRLLGRLEQSPVRLSNPRDLGREAWRIATDMGWARTYDAEYLALDRQQATLPHRPQDAPRIAEDGTPLGQETRTGRKCDQSCSLLPCRDRIDVVAEELVREGVRARASNVPRGAAIQLRERPDRAVGRHVRVASRPRRGTVVFRGPIVLVLEGSLEVQASLPPLRVEYRPCDFRNSGSRSLFYREAGNLEGGPNQ